MAGTGTVTRTDGGSLPDAPGLYRLWMDVHDDLRLRVGAVGEVAFPAGRYAYTGSAGRGIRARVERHLRRGGPLRWHIDYLLPHATVVCVEAHPHAPLAECALNAEALAWPEASIAIPRFGASDCRCPGHLIRVPLWMPVPPGARTLLPSGEGIFVRLLRPDDAGRLGAYFLGLGDRTKSRYAPHAFDQATADVICAALDPRDMLRIVATVGAGDDEQFIAYLLLKRGVRESDGKRYAALGIELDPAECGALAPSVADAWQGRGVASAVMPVLIAMARSVGIRRLVLWDGVVADNERAMGFYRKWGFVKVGEFTNSVLNHDMIAEIGPQPPATVLQSPEPPRIIRYTLVTSQPR